MSSLTVIMVEIGRKARHKWMMLCKVDGNPIYETLWLAFELKKNSTFVPCCPAVAVNVESPLSKIGLGIKIVDSREAETGCSSAGVKSRVVGVETASNVVCPVLDTGEVALNGKTPWECVLGDTDCAP